MELIFDRIRKSGFCNRVLHIFSLVGLDMFFVRLMYRWFEKHPTGDMERSKEFFEENRQRVENNIDILEDEKSKRIYANLIEFRKTMNYRIFPGREEPQYFPKDIIKLGSDEIFIDCGGYIGDTALEFIHQTDNKYKKIIMFEPNMLLEKEIHKNLDACHDVEWVKKGVYDRDTILEFEVNETSSSRVAGDDNKEVAERNWIPKKDTIKIPVTSIDKWCNENAMGGGISLIKMDLEGSEMPALCGARETILRDKPKLAICIYHSDEDMVRIIEYIHALVPDYKIYVRHHSTAYCETVMYAVPLQ